MKAREYFNIKPCTNPVHEISIGRFLLHWQWAVDNWCHITNRDHEVVHWIRVGTTRNMEGQKLYEIIVGKLSIMWGFAS